MGTLFIARGNPWENGYVESAGGKLHDELLNQELFLSLAEVRWVIDRWRLDYNHHRIQSALDYQTPATCAAGCVRPASATPQPPDKAELLNPDSLTQTGTKMEGVKCQQNKQTEEMNNQNDCYHATYSVPQYLGTDLDVLFLRTLVEFGGMLIELVFRGRVGYPAQIISEPMEKSHQTINDA